MSVELFSENIFPEPTLSEILGIDSSIRSVGGIIEGTNIKSSSGSGGVAILPPENTDIGLYVYDNEGNTVFNTLIDGDNVGDVYLGDFANNQGIWYDKSAGASGTVYIKGNVYIGGTTVFESGYDPSGKANVFRQDTEPASGMVEKDIWIDTNNGDKPYSYNGSAWIAQYTIIDGGSISTGTIDADLVTVSNLVVGTNVGLGTAEDSAGVTTIVGGVVTTEYLNARNIKAGSIDAEDIIAGTITGSKIRTASSGRRIELVTEGTYANRLTVYDDSGNLGLSMYDSAMFGGWSNSSIDFDVTYGLKVGFPFPTADAGYIIFKRNASQNSGTCSPEISGYPTLKITGLSTPTADYDAATKKYVDDNAGGVSALSGLSIDTEKSWSGYGITGLGALLPNTNNSHTLGSADKNWSHGYFGGNIYIDGTVDGVNVSAHKARHYAGGSDAVIRTDQSSGSSLGISSGWAYTHDNNASAHHTAFTASSARSAIGNLVGSDGHLDKSLDCDGYDITDLDDITCRNSSFTLYLSGGTTYYLTHNAQTDSGHNGVGLGNLADTVPNYTGWWELGVAANKWYAVTALNYNSCPLPSVASGIDSFKKIKEPKSFKGEVGERFYIKDEDVPDEMKSAVMKKDSNGHKYISDEKVIELNATIGVSVQAIRELITKVETLEGKIALLEKETKVK